MKTIIVLIGIFIGGVASAQTSHPLPITGGGTGATTAAQARANLGATAASDSANRWSINGNSGTTFGSNFLGTTDTASLMLGVNGLGLFSFQDSGKMTINGENIVHLVAQNNHRNGLTLQDTTATHGLFGWGMNSPSLLFISHAWDFVNAADSERDVRITSEPSPELISSSVMLSHLKIGVGNRTSGFWDVVDISDSGISTTGMLNFGGAIAPNDNPGVSGQVLTSQGPNVAPVWTTPVTTNKAVHVSYTGTPQFPIAFDAYTGGGGVLSPNVPGSGSDTALLIAQGVYLSGFGYYANPALSLTGILTMSFDSVVGIGADINGANLLQLKGANLGLKSLSFPLLTSCLTTLIVSEDTTTDSISFPRLKYYIAPSPLQVGARLNRGGHFAYGFPSLQYISPGLLLSANDSNVISLSMPSLINADNNVGISCSSNPTLANVVISAVGTAKNFTSRPALNLSRCALTQQSVDSILHVYSSLDGTNGTVLLTGGTIDVSGGTSSAPSATGLTYEALLVGRGVTVTTN